LSKVFSIAIEKIKGIPYIYWVDHVASVFASVYLLHYI
jgi:hypothetical protein